MNFDDEMKELCEGSTPFKSKSTASASNMVRGPKSSPDGAKSAISTPQGGVEKLDSGHPGAIKFEKLGQNGGNEGFRGLPLEVEKGLPDSSKPLRNLNHERFAVLVVSGKSDTAAYKESYQCSQQSAEDSAWKLRRDSGITRRINYLQKRVTDGAVLTIRERREKLATIVRYKADLSEMKVSDQIAALKLDAEMAGELTPGGHEKTPMRLRLIAHSSGDAHSIAAEIDGI